MTAVAELTGANLALWVAHALKLDDACIAFDICRVGKRSTPQRIDFAPHEDWEQGGPLLEQHTIGVTFGSIGGHWHGLVLPPGRIGLRCTATGPTPLVAAMRALVFSVYGDIVPDEVDL